MVTSGYEVPGYTIRHICKMVFVRRKVLNLVFYSDKPKQQEAWNELCDGIISDMEAQAADAGGNCVIGFRLEMERMPDAGGFIAIIATGTAVYAEPQT